MVKLFKLICNFLFSKSISNTFKEEIEVYQSQSSQGSQDILTNDIQDEYFESLKLNSMRNQAIIKCNGCTDEVFVLKENGEDIGYYPNLNDLAIKNGFHSSSVYRYWRTKVSDKRFLKKYEIVNLS